MTRDASASILETVGNTPTVRLTRIPPKGAGAIHVKLEQLSPTASMKDRLAAALLDGAQSRLQPGKRVVIATQGNLGISLAMVCAMRGLRMTAVLPDDSTLERRAVLRLYGVKVELTQAEQGLAGAIARAEQLAHDDPEAVFISTRAHD